MSTDTAPSNAETPTKPVHVESEAELDALVSEHELVLVDFYTKGCTLCQSIEPVLGNVARAKEELVVALCNPREDLSLVERFSIRSVPTLVLFEEGEEVGRLAEGFQGAQAVVDFVEDARSER
ncbi:thioredoxin family protein [Halopelagius longus]|uniref:Thioredoxin n=1 Tax=Halopelagius longus TaxID=1236180 RepID=A0A1H0Z5H1_9EURY|nr:thioredoxin [Halopelagius longus]SDQ22737.1 Thioredoxin [Halopelagius longus]